MVEVASQRTFPATSSLLVPEIFASASLPWSHPALKAKVCWVGACVGSFLGSPTLLSALQRLVWASFSHLSSASVSWGLGTLVSSHWLGLYVTGIACSSFRSPSPTFVPRDICGLESFACHAFLGP